ncbi:MAG: 30S ribosomal protein S13 [Euryarchaeota archaeon]|nr:30S ribosomal protein S13 [Euryarchaeota archaeon]
MDAPPSPPAAGPAPPKGGSAPPKTGAPPAKPQAAAPRPVPKGEVGKDFRHIVRLVNTDLDGRRTVEFALRRVKGIGARSARAIAQLAGVDPGKVIGYLPEEEVEKLRKAIESFERRVPPWMVNRRKDLNTGENRMMVGTDWVIMVREDIELMKRIRSYKGIRHDFGYKVRGQRTKSTGRKGAVVGVTRKKMLAKLKEAKAGEKPKAAAAPAAAAPAGEKK